MSLTELNSKVKIVDGLFVGPEYRTQVWIEEAAGKALENFMRERVGLQLAKKVKEYAKAGFSTFASTGGPIRYEWDGVHRIGIRASLFRLIGFYNGQDEFVIMDAYLKRGQELSSSERRRIDTVARIMASKSWKKRAKK